VRDHRERDRDRLARSGQRRRGRGVGAHAVDGRRLRLPVEEIEVGGVVGLVADGRADGDEARRVGKRQRLEQHAVDDAEDGRIRADAQRQHQHHDGRFVKPLREGSDGVSQVCEHESLKSS
jgi:hypothetical protein